MIVKIFKESQTKTGANKSHNSRGVLKTLSELREPMPRFPNGI